MLDTPRTVVRREAGIFALERTLQRRGFLAVAGADEAGRGACAGPLVVAAAILPPGRRGEVPGLADSKLLTPAARERVYAQVVSRALAYAVVHIPASEVDRRGLQVCNLAGMRRALAALTTSPDYVLTDGFAVPGLGAPALAVWKGDRVAACVAAASVLAKVTRDRVMVELDQTYPGYGFAEHKGYSTDDHMTALAQRGPCPEHRFSYANVALAASRSDVTPTGAAVVGDRLASSPAVVGDRLATSPAVLGDRLASSPAVLGDRLASSPAVLGDRLASSPDVLVGSARRRGRSSVSVQAQVTKGRTE